MASSAQIQALVAQFVSDLGLADQIIQGGPTTVVQTAGGAVKSFANAIKSLNLVGAVRFTTLVDLNANLTFDAGILAQVEGDATTANNGVYVKSGPNPGGAWTKLGDTAITALNALYANLTAKVAPDATGLVNGVSFGTVFEDANGLVAGGIDANLDWHVFSSLYTQAGEKIGQSTDPNVIFQVNDANGKVALRISADGTSDFIPGGGSSSSAGSLKNALGADIVHIVMRGQSLWQGAQAEPPVTLSPLGYGGLMFGGYGVRTWDQVSFPLNPENRPADHFNLVPLVEADANGVGETIASGMVAQINSMILGHFSGRARSSGQQILVTFPDQGGRFLDEISKTPVVPDGIGAYYATFEDDVKRAMAATAAQNKSYSVLLIDFGQGEANGLPSMTRGGATLTFEVFWPLYRDQLLQLRTDMQTSVQTITGKATPVPMFTYQTEGPISGHAQMMAMDKLPTLDWCVGPHYDVGSALNSHWSSPVLHGNDIHRSADGTRLMGCRHGKMIVRRLVYGEDVYALRILGAKYIGSNQVKVTLKAPRPPVVIDTTWLPKQIDTLGAWGFSIWTGAGSSASQSGCPTVTNCQVTGPEELTLTLSGALPASPALHYARFPQCAPITPTLLSYTDGAGSIYGYAAKVLTFTGSIKASLQPLVDEGAFYIDNMTAPRVLARAMIIRSVVETGGQTLLTGQVNEVDPSAAFVAGDQLRPSRGDPFGNIRDSDNEYCPLSYGDTTYGTRTGNYPMWNWLATDVDVGIT